MEFWLSVQDQSGSLQKNVGRVPSKGGRGQNVLIVDQQALSEQAFAKRNGAKSAEKRLKLSLQPRSIVDRISRINFTWVKVAQHIVLPVNDVFKHLGHFLRSFHAIFNVR